MKPADVNEIILGFTLFERVIGMILVMFTLALIFLTLTMIKRYRKIRHDRLTRWYERIIHERLNIFLFSDEGQFEDENNFFRADYSNNVLFHKVAIKTMVGLYTSYSGEYKKRLEEFFVRSGLLKYAAQNLEASRWYLVVEGIRDISGLGFQGSTEQIRKMILHPNRHVRREAVVGLIRLGEQDLYTLIKTANIRCDAWERSNILYALRISGNGIPSEIIRFLNDKDPLVVLLGLDLIQHYRITELLDEVKDLTVVSEDNWVKKRALKIVTDHIAGTV